MYLTKISQWGNSQGIRIPCALMREIGLVVGDKVDIQVKEGEIFVSKIKKDGVPQGIVMEIE